MKAYSTKMIENGKKQFSSFLDNHLRWPGYSWQVALQHCLLLLDLTKQMYVASPDKMLTLQIKLAEVAPATNQDETIKLINNTLDTVEDAYSGVPKQKGMPTVDDGRMYGILDDKFVTTLEDGTKIANQRNNRIVLHKDGGFQIQSKDGKQTYFTKPGAQTK